MLSPIVRLKTLIHPITGRLRCPVSMGLAYTLILASGIFAAEVAPVVKPQAQGFPLSAVKLLDGPFKQAMEVDKAFLLRVEPDRLLAGFRMQAGLPKKAEPYDSPEWEAIDPKSRYTLAGHSLGHYLSALAMMAAATGDTECRRRADYIVSELDACQKAVGTGMLTAFPDSRGLFAELAAGKIETNHLFILNGGYVPFYSIHKVMAGLRDAWALLGDRTAREILIRKADWLGTVFEKLTDAQVQEVLETEHGGIADILADVYALSGDASHLKLARRFIHKKIFEPLAKGEDPLTSVPPAPPVHANAQIPIVIGLERLYELTGEKPYAAAAKAFWNNVVNTRSFVIGGHGANEFFFPVEEFATTGLMSRGGPETCNTYNMIKLSRKLWLNEPSVETADFIERCLYNHILVSQDPEEGGFAYYTPMRPGAYRSYCDSEHDFWCCTGTGMENHAKYGEFIYAHSGNRLWLDMLVASELDWAEQGVKARLETRFPEDGKATLTFTVSSPRALALSVRYPGWMKPGTMRLSINGESQKVEAEPGSYATVERTWKTGDRLEVEWPLALRTEMLPRSREWAAVLWGPIVLAGKLGTEGMDGLPFHSRNLFPKKLPFDKVPVFVGNVQDIVAKIKPVPGKLLEFRTEGLASPTEVTLAPFYTVHKQRYSVYWQLKERGSAQEAQPNKPEVKKASGPYLGETPPGPTPKVFARGVISVDGTREHSLAFSPKGDELFFARGTGWPQTQIMHMKKRGEEWSKPEPASFLKGAWGTQPVFSPDGQYLFFSSSLGKSDIEHYSLWRVKKEGDGWSEPENIIDKGGKPFMEFHPSVTRDYSVYFLYWDFAGQTGDLYVSRLVDGKYADPVMIGPPVSTEYNEVRPTVDPDERYLLFESVRPDGYGDTDIYVTYRNDDGTWSSPLNLGPSVNTASSDDSPHLSPDGKYWFYGKDGDIWWREAPALPDPRK